ncbi:hypothetical protein MLD38_007778 [Melastoma candidum]|uniref:Uncharacterized protein n=1 Tax=Melastoma candidum TaxID=119954 RepID=A0ACB9RU38_9MYRT|nr:hypothetical protein MLD38_007778 [Melastoma candidum]
MLSVSLYPSASALHSVGDSTSGCFSSPSSSCRPPSFSICSLRSKYIGFSSSLDSSAQSSLSSFFSSALSASFSSARSHFNSSELMPFLPPSTLLICITGKSSLVATIENYLKFDVYDLNSSGVCGNWELRRALAAPANQSILVVEDINCNGEISDRSSMKDKSGDQPACQQQQKNSHVVESPLSALNRGFITQLTDHLSGQLNFTDGLWSRLRQREDSRVPTNHSESSTLLSCGQGEWICTFTCRIAPHTGSTSSGPTTSESNNIATLKNQGSDPDGRGDPGWTSRGSHEGRRS